MRRPAHLTVLTLAATPLVVLAGPASQADGSHHRAARPDLSVTALKAPTAATTGTSVRLVATVKASGARAAASKVRFYLSPDKKKSGGDDVLATTKAPALASGGTTKVSASPDLPKSLGPRFVIACADATQVVAESDEGDNCRATPLWVRPRPRAYATGSPDPLTVTPSTGTKSVHKSIGVAGGTLTLTSAGTTYTLTIPAKALISAEVVRMTPLTGLSGSKMSGGLVAGVDLQPEGLTFLKPYTLTIKPSAAVPVAKRTGFAYAGAGGDFHLYGLQPKATPTLRLTHFTGVGLGSATDADRSAIADRVPLRSEAQWESKLADFGHRFDALHDKAVHHPDDASVLDDQAEIMGEYGEALAGVLRQVAIPKLKAALAGDTTKLGPSAIRSMLAIMRQMELMGTSDEAYQELFDQAWSLMIKVVDKMIPDALNRCVTEKNPYMAMLMLSVVRQQSLLGTADRIDVPLTEMAKCLRFEVDFETELAGDGYTTGDPDDTTTFTDYGFHLRATGVPVRIDVDQILAHTPVTGSGHEDYLDYYGDSSSSWTQYDPESGDPYTCTATAKAAGTQDGVFHVRDLDLDLNYYADDPQFKAPFRLKMLIDPGRVGAADAPADFTAYASPNPDCRNTVTIKNWFWGLNFWALHLDENPDGNGKVYDIEGFTPGPDGSGLIGTKTWDRDVQGEAPGHEVTTVVLRHTPSA